VRRAVMPNPRIIALAITCAFALSGCTTASYYWQSVNGHVQMMRSARPVTDWLNDGRTSEALKARLALSQRIRDFASTELKLPDNPSYRSYADLQRRAVVWNVVAAPPYSLTLKTWCFPVTGCVGYRGYFDEAAAKAEAELLKTTDDLEVSVYGVPAYSTLGWLNWVGGDPLLNTFIGYPEGELARMVFHELAHQVAFASDDMVFNESFATAVERLGAERWLSSQASPAARAEYEAFDAQRRQFKALTLSTRRALQTVYAQKPQNPMDTSALPAMKSGVMQRFRDDYAALKAASAQRGEPPTLWVGYDGWVGRANNASFAAQAAYDDLVPAFEALFQAQGRDWPRFYDAVKQLATLAKDERLQQLKQHLETPHG
jgi:predicted aminopeptidase